MKPPRTKPYPNETALSAGCVKRVRVEWGGEVLNVHGGTAAQTGGQPDLIGCVAGRFFAIELKQPGHEPTPRQWKRLREWQAAGAVAGYATSEAELDELLSHHADTGWVNPQVAASRLSCAQDTT